MLKKLIILAAGCLAIGGLILGPAGLFAASQRGGHFGGGGHVAGGGGHFGGFRGGGIGRAGGMRTFGRSGFTARRFGGFNRRRAFTSRGIARRGNRFAAMHRAARSPHTMRSNQRSIAALRNRANRIANARNNRLAGAGAQHPAAGANLRHGNAFANERFGGHGFRDRDRGFHRFWAGGVFWPYFFGDYVSFAFWPYDYYDAFWGYGPDALIWSAFWPGYDYPYWEGGYSSAAYAGDIYGRYRQAGGRASRPAQRAAGISPQEAAASCAGFAPGVNDLPLERIAAAIEPTPEQQAVFEDLKAAMAKASSILSGACPEQVPATPVARLDAMEQRLRAMQHAEDAIREPLLRLYGLLSESQKQRLDAAAESQSAGQRGSVDLAKLCSSQAGFTNVPEDSIVRTIKLDDQQIQDLGNLKQASARAADILRSSCPANVPETLDARLDAAAKRTSALIEAVDTVRPQVETFFASLTAEQKTALKSQAPGVKSASARRR
jgi:hypothetical protein